MADFEVNIGLVEQVRERYETEIETITKCQEDMAALVDRITESWKGTAGSVYAEDFRMFHVDTLRKLLESLTTMKTTLKETAEPEMNRLLNNADSMHEVVRDASTESLNHNTIHGGQQKQLKFALNAAMALDSAVDRAVTHANNNMMSDWSDAVGALHGLKLSSFSYGTDLGVAIEKQIKAVVALKTAVIGFSPAYAVDTIALDEKLCKEFGVNTSVTASFATLDIYRDSTALGVVNYERVNYLMGKDFTSLSDKEVTYLMDSFDILLQSEDLNGLESYIKAAYIETNDELGRTCYALSPTIYYLSDEYTRRLEEERMQLEIDNRTLSLTTGNKGSISPEVADWLARLSKAGLVQGVLYHLQDSRIYWNEREGGNGPLLYQTLPITLDVQKLLDVPDRANLLNIEPIEENDWIVTITVDGVAAEVISLEYRQVDELGEVVIGQSLENAKRDFDEEVRELIGDKVSGYIGDKIASLAMEELKDLIVQLKHGDAIAILVSEGYDLTKAGAETIVSALELRLEIETQNAWLSGLQQDGYNQRYLQPMEAGAQAVINSDGTVTVGPLLFDENAFLLWYYTYTQDAGVEWDPTAAQAQAQAFMEKARDNGLNVVGPAADPNVNMGDYFDWLAANSGSADNAKDKHGEVFGLCKKGIIDGTYSAEYIASSSDISVQDAEKIVDEISHYAEISGSESITLVDYPDIWDFAWQLK